MGRMVSSKKDCIGWTLSKRPEMNRDDAEKLVGFRPVDRSKKLIAGAHFINKGDEADMANDQGWMTSVAWSPSLDHSVGLGFIKSGDTRIGEIVRAVSPVHNTEMEVEIVSAHFIDPEGERLRV
jgi:sarcosine oxidase subunit alpha